MTVISKSEQEIEKLNEQMQVLQDARIGAETGGLSELADQFTEDINRIRQEITALGGDVESVGPKVAAPLRAARDAIRGLLDSQNLSSEAASRYTKALLVLNTAIADYDRAAKLGVLSTNSVASGFEQMDRNARNAAGSISVLASQVKNLSHASDVLGDKLLKIQSEGGTPQQQIAVLQSRVQTNQSLVAELETGGRQPGDITKLRKARSSNHRRQQGDRISPSGTRIRSERGCCYLSASSKRCSSCQRQAVARPSQPCSGSGQEDIAERLREGRDRGERRGPIRLNAGAHRVSEEGEGCDSRTPADAEGERRGTPEDPGGDQRRHRGGSADQLRLEKQQQDGLEEPARDCSHQGRPSYQDRAGTG